MRNQIYFFALLFFVLGTKLSAVTKTSIANGNWSNATIWSPSGVPALTDNVIINTDVILDQPAELLGFSNFFTINAGASLISFDADTFVLGVENALIDGELSIGVFYFGTRNVPTDSLVNNGIIKVEADMISGATLVNNSSGQICIGRLLSHYDFMTNNGSISVPVLANAAIVSGTGRFCIAFTFMNLAYIGGTVDICDAIPNDSSDFNMGTIAPSVTYCQAAPCALCLPPNSVSEVIDVNTFITVSPNPFATAITIQINPTAIETGNSCTLELLNATGQQVRSILVTATQVEIERGDLPAGIYFCRVLVNGVASGALKVMAE